MIKLLDNQDSFGSTDVTDGSFVTTARTALQDAVEAQERVCDVCRHADARHDRVAHRYCEATLTNALSRTCICAGV